jgi:ribosomal protein S18 acetylase RimI-like enzyme
MENFILKDGTRAVMETWNYDDIETYVNDKELVSTLEWNTEHVKGFHFLHPRSISWIKKINGKYQYSKAMEISPMEMQEDRSLSNEDYTKSVVVLQDDSLIGILICQWINEYHPFWRYHTKFMDVHDNYQKKGIGRAMVRYLNKSYFLNNKILEIGGFHDDVVGFLPNVFDEEMKGKQYAFIPRDYKPYVPPTKPGVYDNMGKKIK